MLVPLLLVAFTGHAQIHPAEQPAASGHDTIFIEKDAAWQYIEEFTGDPSRWRDEQDAMRSDLIRLLNHSVEPYDSITKRLEGMDLSSIPVNLKETLQRDSMEVRWLNDSTFILDSVGWNPSLFMNRQAVVSPPVDFSVFSFPDYETEAETIPDSLAFQPDTSMRTVIDTMAIEALGIKMLSYTNHTIEPVLDVPEMRRSAHISHDSIYLVYTDTIARWEAAPDSPFYRLEGQSQLDSLGSAVALLLESNQERDSTHVIFRDLNGDPTALWLTTGSHELARFWAKNYKNDSITLWLGNPAPLEISLMLEDEIRVNRLVRQELEYLPIELAEPDRSLVEMTRLKQDAIFWDYDFTSSFTLNQTYLSNWTKGGESSLATLLDITGIAIYNNKDANTEWINSIRLNLGSLLTPEKGLRKNNDLFEINSKFNRNASGKIGLSASFYMKTQLAKGFNYPNDSVIVSKFLNPGSLTLGLGAEYKPFKNTSINMAPLSYKNTFVLDTAQIDQTKHGIDPDKRSKRELGTQVVVLNKFTAIEDLTVTNRLRLFSNYLYKPQNIDVDWEMLLDRKINWFFTIRLNLHLIYDDDVRFTVLDAEDQPVLNPDGSEKKVAKAQFKEFLGLSLLFQF
jgi:hypothetical protein